MAEISSSIQLTDRMTPVLQSITTAMQQAVAGASAQLAQYQEELERVQNIMINSENGFFITARNSGLLVEKCICVISAWPSP